jgi:hypothetical protein
MLINRLQDSVLGKCTMTPSQVRAARLVLHKTSPDLRPVKVKYETAPAMWTRSAIVLSGRQTARPDSQGDSDMSYPRFQAPGCFRVLV